MRVLFISDFGLQHTCGGAQRSNDIIINKGKERGHDVKLFTYDGDIALLNDQYDIVVSSNLEVISGRYPQLVVAIGKLANHVRLEHDSNLYWDNDFRKYFWGSCRKSFFLTEFHHKFFVEMYGDIFPNVCVVPDPIDKSFTLIHDRIFPDMKTRIGYVGFMHPLKGTDNFIQYVSNNPEKKFRVAAWGSAEYESTIRAFKNVEFLGEVPFRRMPEFYNDLESLYYNPVCNEPFCRSVGEALLCGTKIIGGSSKIGSLNMYNDDPIGFREKCLNAADKFWEEIECL